MIRVLVVDDQELVLDGLSVILSAQPDIEVVGTASDGQEAVKVACELGPDVVLMDVRMPGLDGIQATKAIVEQTECRVVVLTTYDSDDHVIQALRAGASGFLTKDTPRQALLTAVRAAADGTMQLPPATARRLLDAGLVPGGDPELISRVSSLSPREREVLSEVGEGRTNAEIAAALFISQATVKTHVAHLQEKLQARDRVRLVVIAHRMRIASEKPPQ